MGTTSTSLTGSCAWNKGNCIYLSDMRKVMNLIALVKQGQNIFTVIGKNGNRIGNLTSTQSTASSHHTTMPTTARENIPTSNGKYKYSYCSSSN